MRSAHPDRRSALALGALAAASLARPGPGHGARPAPDLKLGIASFSLRMLPVEELIAFCTQAGVEHVTLKDKHLPLTASPSELAAIVGRFRAACITIMGGGVVNLRGKGEAEARAVFEYARAAGLPMLVVAPERDSIDVLERLVREFGVAAAIHNHGPGDKRFATPLDALALLRGRDRRLGVCMDVGHAFRAGADPVRLVKTCGDRLLDVHLKDVRERGPKDQPVPVGRGAVDTVAVLRALLAQRFAGHVALEYEGPEDDPRPGVRESLAFVRGALAVMRGRPLPRTG